MISLLFSALLLASDPTAATSVASNPAEQPAPAAKEKKVCKNDPSYTGSRMKKKICLSSVEWEKREARGTGSFGTTGTTSSARTQ